MEDVNVYVGFTMLMLIVVRLFSEQYSELHFNSLNARSGTRHLVEGSTAWLFDCGTSLYLIDIYASQLWTAVVWISETNMKLIFCIPVC